MNCSYCNILGELTYAIITCHPDISYATYCQCAQSSACPAEVHYRAVKHCMRYLYATRKEGNKMTPSSAMCYVEYSIVLEEANI